MARKHNPEENIGKLREAEIVLAQVETVADDCRRIGVLFARLHNGLEP
jgi:putative transposase